MMNDAESIQKGAKVFMTMVYSVLAFLFGSVFSSFAQLVADRLDRNESIGGRSRCESCGSTLRLIDVVPIFGYLFSRGRCRICRKPIPFRHVLTELLGGLLFTAEYLIFGWSWELAVGLITIVVMLSISLSDIATKTVHDRVWLFGWIPLILIRIIDGTFLRYGLSAAVLFGLLYLLAFLGERLMKKEALGGGDVKLGLFIGFVLTWDQGLLALFLAALGGFLLGMIGKRKGKELPFVPFLFAGVLIAHAAGREIIAWYLGILGG